MITSPSLKVLTLQSFSESMLRAIKNYEAATMFKKEGDEKKVDLALRLCDGWLKEVDWAMSMLIKHFGMTEVEVLAQANVV